VRDVVNSSARRTKAGTEEHAPDGVVARSRTYASLCSCPSLPPCQGHMPTYCSANPRSPTM